MAKDLERDLGLYATITISIGAMVGSGIFVLPGLATKIAGPAVILAYLLAGLLVLPAALSKAEMATAMPEAGGTYLYIDRAMGPLAGTIAGVGAWFSLVFKSAFALVGLGAYLLVFVAIPGQFVNIVGVGLGLLLIAVNIVGVKQTGRLQAIIVTVVIGALVLFIADGLTYVDQARYHPFFPHGSGSVLVAAGFVFVSYAGVTKIASVAEEVENPGRNIPIGILGSIVLMMLVYTFVVYVVVGVTPESTLETTLKPMADAAAGFAGPAGQVAVAVVAVFALTSMANAGILSSARFPLALSRDSLAPERLGVIHSRFKTPVAAIAFTGAVLLVLVAFVPVVDLAKLASAFQILVFAFENVALIAFRESGLTTYEPEFVAPGYPWVQLFGILGGFVLLTQLGALPLLGALGIILGGYGWYQVYGRERTEREGAALDAIRHSATKSALVETRRAFTTGGGGGILVVLGPGASPDAELTLLEIASDLRARRGGQISAVRFERVPDQAPLPSAAAEGDATEQTNPGVDSPPRTATVAVDREEPITVDEVVAHDVGRAIANYVKHHGLNVVIGARETEFFHGELAGADVDWYMENVPADLIFVEDRGIGQVEEIAVVGDRGPYDPTEVLVANAIAEDTDAILQFLYAVDESTTEEELDQIAEYHDSLAELCTVETRGTVLPTDDRKGALLEAAEDADLAVVGTSPHHLVYDVVFGALPDDLADELDCTVLLVHSDLPRRQTFLRGLIERVAY